MIKVKPFNVGSDGTSHIIKSQYYKMGAANVLDVKPTGAYYKATGAIIEYL